MLSACDTPTAPPDSKTAPVPSAPSPSATLFGSTVLPPQPQGTSPAFPVPKLSVTVSVPDAITTAQFKRYGPPPPTATSTPTIDPAAPTYTPEPTSTPWPTPQPTPPLVSLTDRVPDPHKQEVMYFAGTGHTLSGVFLLYWQQHGGVAQLGQPVTEEFAEFPVSGGTIPPGNTGGDERPTPYPDVQLPFVQYFERAKLELPPDTTDTVGITGTPASPNSPGVSSTDVAATVSKVRLTPDGEEIAKQKGYYRGLFPRFGYAPDYSWLAGVPFVDASSCLGCPCEIFRFTLRTKTSFPARPEGPVWYDWSHEKVIRDHARTPPGEQSYNYNDYYTVVFGHFTQTPAFVVGGSCRQPTYLVTKAQENQHP